MVSLPGWTFSDSCPFCHLFILFVFCFFIFVFALVCLLYFALLLVVIAVVLCLIAVVLCLIAGYCCCTLPFISCLFFLLLFACGCTCCSLLFSTAFVLFASFALDIQALFGTCCLLSSSVFCFLCAFRLCFVPAVCCRSWLFVFCSLTFASASFDLEGNGLCRNDLGRNGKAATEERRFAGFLCRMDRNGKNE